MKTIAMTITITILGIGQASNTVEDARTRDSQTGSGPASEVAHGLGGVASGLFVPHPDILDTFLLCCNRNLEYRE